MTAVRDLPSSVRTREQRRVLARGLRKLKREGPRNPTYGICLNLRTLVFPAEAYLFVAQMSSSWSKYSGRPEWPVPWYPDGDNLWAGDQGKLRMELIDHLLNELKEMGL